MNSRRKGKTGELECVAYLRAHGFEARRGVQFSGGPNSPDIIHNIPGVHIEVKRCERGNPYDWMKQAARDCGGLIPVVWHRRNNEEPIVFLRAGDFLKLEGVNGEGGGFADRAKSTTTQPRECSGVGASRECEASKPSGGASKSDY